MRYSALHTSTPSYSNTSVCYPIGMQIQDRSWKSSSMLTYRFSFNGMEQDNEVKGQGNSYDFGARIYDSRLGKWMSGDLKTSKYPSLTPYHFAANNPIIFVDRDGKDIYLEYILADQWSAFKTMVEGRFDGSVTVSYQEVKFERNRVVNGKIETYTDVKYKMQMTFNDAQIEQKIRDENPDATVDVIATKISEYKKSIESNYTFDYLNTLINTKENGTLSLQLSDCGPFASYEGRAINASSIAKAGEYRFTMLFHEIVEQVNRANKLKLDGLNSGYPSHHWDALIKQAKDLGANFVINSKFLDGEGNYSLTYDLYTAIKKDGKVTGYTKTSYSFTINVKEIISEIEEGETTTVSVAEFNNAVSAEKSKINEAFPEE